jgi:TP901 family phage tail tape measure protein
LAEIGSAYVRLRPSLTGFRAEATAGVSQAMAGVTRSAARTALAVAGGFSVARIVAGIGRVGIAYEDALNTFQSVTRATETEIGRVGATARRLGNDLSLPSTSAADAAGAMTELARAGLSVNESMAAARGTLQLAAAAQTDDATAAQLTAGALNAFHLSGRRAVQVADLLAAAANASAASATDLGFGLQSASAIAYQAGISIDELTTVLAQMSNAGIDGAVAGTSFRSLLVSLQNPTEKASGALEQLNVSLYDQQGRMKPLINIIGQFQRGAAKLTQAQRNQAFATIAGTYGLTALNTLVEGGTAGFERMQDAVNRQGAAAEVAAARSKGLGGALRGLESTLETAALAIYDRFAPGLTDTVRELARWISATATSEVTAQRLATAATVAGDVFRGVGEAVRTVGPLLLQAASAGNRVVQSLGGFDTLLVAVGSWKAYGVALAVAAAAQRAFAVAQAASSASQAARAASTAATVTATTAQAAASDRAAASTLRLGAANATTTASYRALAVSAGAAGAAQTAAGAGGLAAGAGAATGRLSGLAAGLRGLVTSSTGIGIAMTAAAAGIYFLATRSSSAEVAARNLSSALQGLGNAQRGLLDAQQQLAQNRLDVRFAASGVAQARYNLEVAKTNRANRELNQTDQQRRANSLAVRQALDAYTQTTRTLYDANQRLKKSQQDITVATRTQEVATRRGVNTVLAQGEAAKRATQAIDAYRGGRVTATQAERGALNAMELNERAVNRFAQAMRKAAADQSLPLNIQNAARRVGEFAKATQRVPDRTTVRFILDNAKANDSLEDTRRKISAFEKKRWQSRLTLDATPFSRTLQEQQNTAAGKGAGVGASLSQGVASGITANSGLISGALGAAIDGAIAAGRARAEARSPSRLTERVIGAPISQGIAVGIRRDGGQVSRALQDVVSAAGPAAARAMEGVVVTLGTLPATRVYPLLSASLRRVLPQGVRDGVNQAKAGLTSIAQSLAGTIGSVLDTRLASTLAGRGKTAIAKWIRETTAFVSSATAEMQREQTRRQRDTLARSVDDARASLTPAGEGPEAGRINEIDATLRRNQAIREEARLRREVADAAALTISKDLSAQQIAERRAETQSSLDEFLLGQERDRLQATADARRAEEERVRQQTAATQALSQAQQELTDFDTQQRIAAAQAALEETRTRLEEEANARKESVTRQLSDLSVLFNQGRIGHKTFTAAVVKLMRDSRVDFAEVGRLQGAAQAEAYRQQILDMAAQATAILAAPHLAGAGFAGGITDPRADLRARLAQLRQDRGAQTRQIDERLRTLMQQFQSKESAGGKTITAAEARRLAPTTAEQETLDRLAEQIKGLVAILESTAGAPTIGTLNVRGDDDAAAARLILRTTTRRAGR